MRSVEDVASTDAAWRWLDAELASRLEAPARRAVATALAPKLRSLFRASGDGAGGLAAPAAPAAPVNATVAALGSQLAQLDESVAVLEVREFWTREVDKRDRTIKRLRRHEAAWRQRAERAEAEECCLRTTLAEVQLRCDRAEAVLRAPLLNALDHARVARNRDSYDGYRRPSCDHGHGALAVGEGAPLTPALLTHEHMRPWRPFSP